MPEPCVYNLAEVNEILAVGVESFVMKYEGIADWDLTGEDEENDPRVIQLQKGGPKGS